MTNPAAQNPGVGGPQGPHVDLNHLLHHTELPETGFSKAVDPLTRAIGKVSAWSWIVLVAVITINVFLRYVLGQGLIQFEELQWHIYAIGFLLGLAWVLEADDHVRIDVLSEHWRFRTRCWVEFIGILVGLMPFIGFVIWYGLPFIAYSFQIHEISEAPGGLPYRWAIKAVLVLAFGLLALATVSRFTRVCAALFTRPLAPAKG